MEKENFVSQDTLSRHKEKSDKLIFQEKAKVSPILDKFVYKSSPTDMSHLSLSKNVNTGPEVKKDTISTSLLRSKVIHDLSPRDKEIINLNKEEPSSQGIVAGLKMQEFKREEPLGVTFVIDKKMVQDTKLSMLLKEAKPVIKVSHQDKCLTPPRDTSTDVWVLDVWSKNESYMLTEVPRKEPYHKLSHKPPHKWKPKSEQWIVQIPRPMVSSMTDIIHLLLVQNVEIISSYTEESFKEIPPDNLLLLAESTPRETRNVATKIFKDHPPQNRCSDHFKIRGVTLSHLLKEEPPDAPCITKPKLYQSKVLNSQKKMKPDLLYLGAGSPVSRSKLCQGKSVMQPSNQ
uniref:Uncharacterized protein n=1 Tax=Brassica oleracea var. oleracea TaxID=109376 RepID=A0A0D3A9T7_BRAOL